MKKIYLLLILSIFLVTTLFSQTLNIYVSPNGSSSGNGTSTLAPVSLSRARTIVKTTANKLKVCHIWLMDGIYTYLALDSTDFRTATAPITYHSLNRLKAIFQPITPINPSDLIAIPDSIKNRIVDSVARTKVMQVDLSKYNLSNIAPWPKLFEYPVTVTAASSSRQNWPIIYQNSTPLPMAQYPNGDSVMRMLKVLNNGGTGTSGSAGIFKYRDDRCKYWSQALKEGLWLRGCWRVSWQMDFVKADSINTTDSIVYQSVGLPGGIGDKYTRPAGNGKEPYIAVNLLEEIDTVGEWAINFNTKMLYIYPPDTGTLNISSNSSTPSISLSYVNYTNFEGITLDGGSSVGIKLNKCNNISIAGMEIKHVASYGVLIADGSNCIVRSNDIHDVGEGGVYLISSTFNADQLLLKSCNHKVINNHIYDYAKDVFLYAAAIDTRNAIGSYCAFNNIHGCKHVGVLFGGNNNTFEYNDISNVVQTYNDMGAFYTAESQTKRGNKIQRNYIHAMNYCGSGLYSDNNAQGQTYYGNIAANCLYGLQNNLGLFDSYLNNIYYDNYRYQCSYEIAFADTVSTSSAYTKVKTVYKASTTYQNGYTELKDYFDTVNKAYSSTVWPQINGSVFIGTSILNGRCISPVLDKSLFLTNGKTNTAYATGIPFTQYGLICNNNFYAKTTSFKGVYTNLLDSLKSTGVFAKTAITDWHINRIGLFKDSIYRPDITATQTAGVSPSFNLTISSLHSFTTIDTLNITVTIKNPNISKCYSSVLLYDSVVVIPSVSFKLTKSTFDSIVFTAKWINPSVGKHSVTTHLLDSTLWDFSSDSTNFSISSTLPVTINNFRASSNNCNALLSWKVADGQGIRYYSIEKENNNGLFEVVKTIAPNTSGINYSITIPQENNISIYRIHISTNTGDIYSNSEMVQTNCSEKETLILLPNPIYSTTYVNAKVNYHHAGNSTASTLSIYDITGKMVVQKQVYILSGDNTFSLPVNGLPKGFYIVKIMGLRANLIVQ